MKVLFVTKGGYKPSGGAQRASRRWYDEISKLVECHLITDQPENPKPAWRDFSLSGPMGYLRSCLLLTKKVFHVAKEVKPDLIHIQSYTGYVVRPPRFIPSVVTLHDEPDFRVNDWVSPLFARIYSRMLGTSESFFRNLMLSRHPAIHAVGQSIKTQLIDMGFPSSKIRVIPNGFPAPPTEAVRLSKEKLMRYLSLPLDSQLVLTVGNICFRKAAHKILLLAQRVQNSHPDVHFLIVGSKDSPLEQAYVSRLLEWRKKHHINNFHLLGYVGNEVLDSLFHHSDMYLSSSLSEACNLALMEAAVQGLPIVSTDVGAARELFEPEGTIIPRNCSVKDLENAVIDSLGVNRNITYNKIKSNSWPDVAQKVVEYYDFIIESGMET